MPTWLQDKRNAAFQRRMEELIEVARWSIAPDELGHLAVAIARAAPEVDLPVLNHALNELNPLIAESDLSKATTLGLACGAIVEYGGDPNVCVDSVLARLPEAIEMAISFMHACIERAKASGGKPPNGFDAVQKHGEIVEVERRRESIAWNNWASMGMATIAMLSRSVDARRKARRLPRLLAAADQLGAIHEIAHLLARMLRVLDDEKILVLHPEQRRGYVISISGIADNAQLHTLLADALIGDAEQGLLSGTKPHPHVVTAARDGDVHADHSNAEGAFNLVNWQGLRADLTISTNLDENEHWIWNEGVPADIEKFEGQRVILLAPPPYQRAWAAARSFRHMEARLEIVETLSPEQVQQHLQRMAEARR